MSSARLYVNSIDWRNAGLSDQGVKLLQGLVDCANQQLQESLDLEQLQVGVAANKTLIDQLNAAFDEFEAPELMEDEIIEAGDRIGELNGLSLMGIVL